MEGSKESIEQLGLVVKVIQCRLCTKICRLCTTVNFNLTIEKSNDVDSSSLGTGIPTFPFTFHGCSSPARLKTVWFISPCSLYTYHDNWKKH